MRGVTGAPRRAFDLVRGFVGRLRGPWDWVGAALVLALVAGGAVATWWVARYAWAINRLTQGVGDLVFFTADGRPWFRMDDRREDVPLAEISPLLQQAVIATEDRRFRYHPGLDPVGIGRAAVTYAREGGRAEGASTITQQLARTLFLSNARTPARKAKEALLALMLEARLTKDQILELYLNRVYLSAGLYGANTMAKGLFGKPARDLTLGEASLIAGLIQAPSALSPWSNLDGALRRRELVLARMVSAGDITEAQAREAKRQRLRLRPHPGAADPRSGYAKEYLRQQFRDRFGGDHPPDWQVHTTFVPALQEAAERAVADGLRRLGKSELQAALVALDPETGDVLAMVGGRDFRASSFNRATRSRRQAGSAFKPFVYAAALARGRSPVSEVRGLASMAPQGDEEWTPRNADGRVPDVLTLRQAFLESNNRAAVALQEDVGRRPVLRLASAAGLRDQPDVPSLALGTGLVTPMALTAAYAAFPNGGYALRPRAIRQVLDDNSDVVLDEPVSRGRVMTSAVAYQMVSLMQDVVDRGTGQAVRQWGVRFPAGGKTGTTNEFYDAWFVGYSTEIVAGVWVGLDQPASIGRNASGSRVALPIWADFMRRAARVRRPLAFEAPDTVTLVPLCRVSHAAPVDGCPAYDEVFKEGDDVPGSHCTVHEGSLKQRAQRAVEGLVSKALDWIFRRSRN